MTNLKKEKIKEEICDWCQRGSSLDIGSGYFRDIDSDFSYGVAVCGGCGGLGRQIINSDFRERVGKISKLRFEYCPLPLSEEIPEVVKLKKLKELIGEVTELFRLYGRDKDSSFAKRISDGCLQSTLEEHQRKIQIGSK